jgi:hypothetical protein
MVADEWSSSFAKEDDDLSKRYDALSDEQKRTFALTLERRSEDRQSELPPYYADAVISTLERGLPAHEEAKELNETNRKFNNDPNWRRSELHQQEVDRAKAVRRAQEQAIPESPRRPDQISKQQLHALLGNNDINNDHQHGLLSRSANGGQPQQQQPNPSVPQRSTEQLARRTGPMEGVRPSGQTHDYGELNRTHAQLNQGPTTPHQAEQTLKLIGDIRADAKLQPISIEVRQRHELSADQARQVEVHQQRYQDSQHPEGKELLGLLQRQHQAETVSLEARLLGQRLKNTGSAQELMDVHTKWGEAAKDITDQRIAREASIDRSQERVQESAEKRAELSANSHQDLKHRHDGEKRQGQQQQAQRQQNGERSAQSMGKGGRGGMGGR